LCDANLGKTINGASHCIVAIAHGQKWVVANAATINVDFVAIGTGKGHLARELRHETRTLLTCCGGGRNQQQQELRATK
jgi:hypothetical protein